MRFPVPAWAVLGAVLLLEGTAHALPTVGLLPLQSAPTVEEGTAAVTALAEALKQATAFARVLPPAEMRTLLDEKYAARLQACVDSACVQDVTGVVGGDLALLDVQYLVSSSLSASGSVRILQLRLINLRNSRMDATLTQTVCAPSDAQWLPSMAHAVATMLRSAKLREVPSQSVTCGLPEKAALVEKPEPRTGSSTSAALPVGVGVAIAGAAVGLVAVLAGVVAVGAFVSLSVGPVVAALPTPGLTRTPRFIALRVPPSVMLASAGALGVISVLVSSGGAILAVLGWMRAE